MRRLWISMAAGVCASILTSGALAQDNPDALRQQYQDAMTQLKAAQDRKNELATENEKLRQQIAELEKRSAEQNQELVEHAKQTWFLRSHYAAWERFVRSYPKLAAQWDAFLMANPVTNTRSPLFNDTEWPFGVGE